MRSQYRYVSMLAIAGVLALPAVISGCATHREYDPQYRDYHSWDRGEVVYYQQWEVETRRDHRDFDRRPPDEQREYWAWRHNHSDSDRDRRDHDNHDNHY